MAKGKFFLRPIANGIFKLNRFDRSISFQVPKKNGWLAFFGGWATLVALILIILYGVVLTIRLVSRNDISIDQNTSLALSGQKEDRVTITESDGLEFLILMNSYRFPSILVEERNFTLQDLRDKLELKIDYSHLSDGQREKYSLPTKEWSPDFFNNINDTFLVTYWCFEIKNITLTSMIRTHHYQADFVEVEVSFCKEDKEQNELEEDKICQLNGFVDYLQEFSLATYAKSKYLDLYDIENPIKNYIELLNRGYLDSYSTNYVDVWLERYEVSFQDSIWINLFEQDPVKFIKVWQAEKIKDDKITFPTPRDDHLDSVFDMRLELTNEKHQYRRTLFSFFELTGILGGIFEVLEVGISIIFGIAYSYYSKQSLDKEIKKNQAKLDEMQDEFGQLKKKFEEYKKSPGNNRQSERENPNNNESIQEEDEKEEDEKEEEKKLVEQQKNGGNKDYYAFLNEVKNINLPSSLLKSTPGKNKDSKIGKQEFVAFKIDEQSNKSVVRDFDAQLDCLDFLFRIKTIEAKLDYLLFKDPEYSELLKSKSAEDKNLNDSKAEILKKQRESRRMNLGLNSEDNAYELWGVKGARNLAKREDQAKARLQSQNQVRVQKELIKDFQPGLSVLKKMKNSMNQRQDLYKYNKV